MAELIDLNTALTGDKPVSAHPDRDWAEFAHRWNDNDMRGAHDWLNERWSRLVASRLQGHTDPEAQFLQGLAFATIALFFTQHRNQDGALLMLDDALVTLARFRPSFLGVGVDAVCDTLLELRPLLVGLAPDDECPMQPFVYRRLDYTPQRLWSRP